jgi:hypothetical protein
MTSAVLAFFVGIMGADLFYRREFLHGFAVFAVLVLGYAAAPLVSEGTAGLMHRIPTLLVLYGWVRAYLYSKSKGL